MKYLLILLLVGCTPVQETSHWREKANVLGKALYTCNPYYPFESEEERTKSIESFSEAAKKLDYLNSIHEGRFTLIQEDKMTKVYDTYLNKTL